MSIPLGSALSYALLAGQNITNTGLSVAKGDIGVSPSGAVVGFPPGQLTGGGTIHTNDTSSADALTSATFAYATVLDTPTSITLSGDIGGQTLTPNNYLVTDDALIVGQLTLDGQNLLSSNFTFNIQNTLSTSESAVVALINGAGSSRVFWGIQNTENIPTAVTIADNSHIHGTISVIQGDIVLGNNVITDALYAIGGNITMVQADSVAGSFYPSSGGDPHIVAFDNSRLDVYEAGYYRLFSLHEPDQQLLINVEIRRDPFDFTDFYHQVYIYQQLPNRPPEITHLQFSTKGVLVDSGCGDPVLLAQWVHFYKVNRDCYKVMVDPHYNTIAISTQPTGIPIPLSGLLSTQIQALSHLDDRSELPSKMISAQFYDRNALVAGSVGPHVLTIQKKSLHPRAVWMRLLQWQTPGGRGIINGRFDERGQLRDLVQKINGYYDQWRWDGDNHWELQPMVNGCAVDRAYCSEQMVRIGDHGQLLLRIQGNGSVSVNFHRIGEQVRGLLTGDQIEICNAYDEYVETLPPMVEYQVPCPENASIYQRLIDVNAS